ncbi:hypothetical protein HUT18_15495 [Streptomyces sp. NA04227]|uniref:hypothetical protein n=1 Tax=Streptomyces sp. NA04227 TaxID=2742136 RepID=UPI001591EE63|nr:hypothetical protein [Streptomyces sp. NA04227]QKW07574.1 hypothetical protein HUT18_15495 [Streptomyces sp. NA04227]
MDRPAAPVEDYTAAQQLADSMAHKLREIMGELGVAPNEICQIRGLVSASGTPYVRIGEFRIGSTMQLIAGLSSPEKAHAVAGSPASPVVPAESFG